MLKFVFGSAATGKTSKILEFIENDVKNNKNAVLIIPEQFSFESERAVLRLLGDRYASSVEVLSFSRICDAVERITGGICGRNLGDSDKLVLMCRAIRNSADELKLWGRYKNSLGFARSVLETVDEFKTNAVSAQMLLDFAMSDTKTSLSDKLVDIATIYQNFDMLLGEKFIDPTDRLTKLYERLLDCLYFENKTVYLDSFKGFTGQQFKIIDRILSQADDVVISLSSDGTSAQGLDVFSNIRKTTEYIKSRAKQKGIKLGDDLLLRNNFYKGRQISSVEAILSGKQGVCIENDSSVTVVSASTVYDEAEFTARTIRRLVRENEDLRYRDFVIIARDTAPYEDAVLSACRKNKVSCFMDKRYPLSAFPPISATFAAIEAINGLKSSAILRFYKSGVTNINAEELSKIENYTYVWNVSGKLWREEWQMNPRGFVKGENDQKTEAELKVLNEIRIKLITPLLNFKDNFKGDAKSRIRAILNLFYDCDYKKALDSMCNTYRKNSDETYKEALVESWDSYMSVLNSMADCMGEGEISTGEFTEILKAAIGCSDVGIVPQMLDEVSFGAADRIRPSRPKIAFVLGANQNVFPKSATSGGLLANNERQRLIMSGMKISDHAVEEAIDEEFLVYTNVCCPTDKLYICYHNIDGEGAEATPSAFVGSIVEQLKCDVLVEPSPLETDNAPETEEMLFSQFCKALGDKDFSVPTITASVSEVETLLEKSELIKNGYNNRDFSITPKTAEKLFGDNLKISPSKLDVFMRCSLSYLLKYGLKIKKLQPADFDVMQRGTIVHYVLERIVSDYKEEISKLSSDKISELVDSYINEYLDGIKGYRSIETARMKYLVFTIARSLKEVVTHLAEEFSQSDFKPCRCELFIGGDEVIAPNIPLDNGKNISVEGVVDRMDTWNGYVRIVDYKTGSRKFRLPDILVGQNMQMLIYLYAIVKNGSFNEKKPAGIFYMPSHRDLKNKGLRMDGLSAENLDLVTAMEKENKGKFVTPLKYKNDGELYSDYKNSFITETDFDTVFKHVENTLYKMGDKIYNGKFSLNPIDGLDSPACKYCDFASVCGIEDNVVECVGSLSNSEVIERIKEEMK